MRTAARGFQPRDRGPERAALRRIVRSISTALATAVVLAQTAPSVEQTMQGQKPALAVVESFDGLGFGFADGPGTNHPPAPRNPSDDSLAVGPDHIVQIVNSQVAVFSKKGGRFDSTGRTLYGPTSTSRDFGSTR